MAAVTILSDFEAQENKVCHCFHFFPFYLPWNDGMPWSWDQVYFHHHFLKQQKTKVGWIWCVGHSFLTLFLKCVHVHWLVFKSGLYKVYSMICLDHNVKKNKVLHIIQKTNLTWWKYLDRLSLTLQPREIWRANRMLDTGNKVQPFIPTCAMASLEKCQRFLHDHMSSGLPSDRALLSGKGQMQSRMSQPHHVLRVVWWTLWGHWAWGPG